MEFFSSSDGSRSGSDMHDEEGIAEEMDMFLYNEDERNYLDHNGDNGDDNAAVAMDCCEEDGSDAQNELRLLQPLYHIDWETMPLYPSDEDDEALKHTGSNTRRGSQPDEFEELDLGLSLGALPKRRF